MKDLTTDAAPMKSPDPTAGNNASTHSVSKLAPCHS